MSHPVSSMEALMHPHTYVKPAATAGTIYIIDKYIRGSPDMASSMALATAVGLSFLTVEFITPHLPKIETSDFSTGAIEERLIEVAATSGILLGMVKLGLYNNNLIASAGNAGGIVGTVKQMMPVLATILIADIAGEGFLPFFGFNTRFHSK